MSKPTEPQVSVTDNADSKVLSAAAPFSAASQGIGRTGTMSASTQPSIRRPAVSALALICAAQFVLQLDFSIVNVALPTMQRELGFAAADLQWVVTGYALTFGSLLLLGGRAGDLLGRR